MIYYDYRTSAELEDRIYLEYEVAQKFTRPDGSSALYIGKEGLLMGLLAYPMPHNAPYAKNFNNVINNVLKVRMQFFRLNVEIVTFSLVFCSSTFICTYSEISEFYFIVKEVPA